MGRVTSLPGQAYDYIHHQYGIVGLTVVGVMIVVAIVSVGVWLDRRK